MNQQQLNQVTTGKGFIAALDQSGGSTPKALKLYGIEESAYQGDAEMFDMVHAMRSRIVTSPAFDGRRVIGAILFEATMDHRAHLGAEDALGDGALEQHVEFGHRLHELHAVGLVGQALQALDGLELALLPVT